MIGLLKETICQYKSYFNIRSVEPFEEKLKEAQEALGTDPHNFVPVTYVSEIVWYEELRRFLPTLVIIALRWYAWHRMQMWFWLGCDTGKGTGGIFNIGKAHFTKLDKNAQNKVYFKDVVGCVGLPGTGKTLLAKATAGESGVPFLSISGSEFMEVRRSGAIPSKKLVFRSKTCASSIVFIEEIDSIGCARGRGRSTGGSNERERTLNQLLIEMDDFGTAAGVVVLVGTNRPDILDKALLRSWSIRSPYYN